MAERIRRAASLDWAELHRRLAAAHMGGDGATSLTAEDATALLADRAARLAQPPADATPAASECEVLIFRLGRERYAIEARFVREITRLSDFTPVPGAPEFIIGVVNLRGEVLAIVDLRRLLGVAGHGLTDQSCLLVLGTTEAELGILSDAVEAIQWRALSPSPDPAAPARGLHHEYVRGIEPDGLILLDGAEVLGDTNLIVDHDRT